VCRLLFYLSVAIFSVYLGGNIWLNSPNGRGFLAKKMAQKSGYHFEISSAYWVPGWGLQLCEVKVFREAGGQQISKIRRLEVESDWASFMEGNVAVKSLIAVQPRFELTEKEVEFFLQKLQQQAPQPRFAASQKSPPKTTESIGKAVVQKQPASIQGDDPGSLNQSYNPIPSPTSDRNQLDRH